MGTFGEMLAKLRASGSEESRDASDYDRLSSALAPQIGTIINTGQAELPPDWFRTPKGERGA